MELSDEKAACPLSLSFSGIWSFGALLESGISLVQFCFVVKNEHKDLFFSSESQCEQTSADFLHPGFHTPTFQLILWPQVPFLLMHRASTLPLLCRRV